MIYEATERDFALDADDECLVRIQALYLAYGFVPFIRYYTDGYGCLMSVMDGVGIFYGPSLSEEWQVFVQMNPDVSVLHCSADNAAPLLSSGQWQGRVGDVMTRIAEENMEDPSVDTSPSLPAVHQLLLHHFPGISPLESWYPDVSHRIRHGRGHIAAIRQDDEVVSTALTVAETDTAAILGQIATSTRFRRQGMAQRCITTLFSACKGKKLYILPLNEIAKKLYEKLGFITTGGWAELERTH